MDLEPPPRPFGCCRFIHRRKRVMESTHRKKVMMRNMTERQEKKPIFVQDNPPVQPGAPRDDPDLVPIWLDWSQTSEFVPNSVPNRGIPQNSSPGLPPGQNLALRTPPSGTEFSPPDCPQGQNLRNYQKSSGLPLGAESRPPEGRIPGLGLNFLFYNPIFPSSTWRLGG